MRFLMIICRDDVPVEGPSRALGDDVEQWVTAMDARGVRITGDPLAPETEATVVRVRDGQQQVSKGAFLTTNTPLIGFDLLECRDVDEAIEVASAHPLAERFVLELRPIAAD